MKYFRITSIKLQICQKSRYHSDLTDLSIVFYICFMIFFVYLKKENLTDPVKECPSSHSCPFFTRSNHCPNMYVQGKQVCIALCVLTLHKWYPVFVIVYIFSLSMFLRFIYIICSSSSAALKVLL